MTTDHTPTAAAAAPLELPTRTDLGIPLDCPAGRAFPVVEKLFNLLHEAGFKPRSVVPADGDDEDQEETPTFGAAMREIFGLDESEMHLLDPDGNAVWVLFITVNEIDVVSDYRTPNAPLHFVMKALNVWIEGKA